jgi:hypothetical protein
MFVALFVALTASLNWLRGEHRPLWTGAVWGFILPTGLTFVSHAERRGWIKSVSSIRAGLRLRQQELAQQRERMLADAMAKAQH